MGIAYATSNSHAWNHLSSGFIALLLHTHTSCGRNRHARSGERPQKLFAPGVAIVVDIRGNVHPIPPAATEGLEKRCRVGETAGLRQDAGEQSRQIGLLRIEDSEAVHLSKFRLFAHDIETDCSPDAARPQ